MTTVAEHSDDGSDRWAEIARRNARSVQTTVGWIFWDPGAIERYQSLGLPEGLAGPLGYIAARCAPLAGAGPSAVIAAFGSISPLAINAVFDLCRRPGDFEAMWHARDAAVKEGLERHAPAILEPLADLGDDLWRVVDRLPLSGRVFFGAHLAMARPHDAVLSGWHAVNCLREWRGDTHWSVITAEGLTHAAASILHNAWLGYEGDWLAVSRGTASLDIDEGWTALERRGLAERRVVTAAGLALRQHIEDVTDRLTTTPWTLLGAERSLEFAERLEPPCELLLRRVDLTAGPNYQPASRLRPRRPTTGPS